MNYTGSNLSVRRKKSFIIHGFSLLIGVIFLTAADDVQVFRSGRSTLSIYSYGGAEPSRVLPEYRDSVRAFRRNTGVLTDVAAVPGRSVSAPPVKSSTNPTFAPKAKTGQTSGYSMHSMSAPSNGSSADASSNPQTVTVGWSPSPESSVAGYYVYTGSSSGQYSGKFPVGNQTITQIPLGQSAVYIAITAYTAEGLESALSEELIVTGSDSEPASAASGDGTVATGIH